MGKNGIILLLILAIAGVLTAGVWMLNDLIGGGSGGGHTVVVKEEFDKPKEAGDGKNFGDKGQLTFELFRNGTFTIDGNSGYAWQKSNSYRDSAIIRTTDPLPPTYKITVVAGDIDYDLENIAGLANDPEYREGPKNENGFYFIAITETLPDEHYTNDWWHQHRKVVMDVDNNVWGQGMPNPIFMVYFDPSSALVSFDGKANEWQRDWKSGVEYERNKFYRVELEKTPSQFIFSVADENGNLLRKAEIGLSNVWHEDGQHPDYFVIGDPHENYYQGSMKIKSITIEK